MACLAAARDPRPFPTPPARPTRPGDKEAHSLQPLRDLLLEKIGPGASARVVKDVYSKNFAGLRDDLLALGPLNVDWIKEVGAPSPRQHRVGGGHTPRPIMIEDTPTPVSSHGTTRSSWA